MGAEQSSTRDSRGGQEGNGAAVKSCYYDILGIKSDAAQDEIKKAYRKKALELHPDRNYGDVEQATTQFAAIQSAYEILSDPQERAWYDSHRDAILHGGGADAEDHFEHNIRLTSAWDIIAFMSKFSKKMPFTDAPNGFYGGLRDMFATLAREEQAACGWEGLPAVQYVGFGNTNDNYEDVVRPFYALWMGFSTKKSYSWKAEYRYSEAPDRRVRRAMEKENKRLCDESIREFNDAVRSLVAFARKRDPRYISNTLSEADRQKTLLEAAAAQAARSRAANQAKLDTHVVPTWAKTEFLDEEDSEELSEEEHYECVICGKLFKSEKQYETHEKSKKHIKATKQLKRQMQKDNKLLNLDENAIESSGIAVPLSESAQHATESEEDELVAQLEKVSPTKDADRVELLTSSIIPRAGISSGNSSDTSESNNASVSGYCADEYASRDEGEARHSTFNISINSVTENELTEFTDVDSLDINSTFARELRGQTGETNHKIGKAKLKREKRAARQEGTPQEDTQFACASCSKQFSSKTKLFNHIKDMNHAQPLQKKQGKRVSG